MFSDSGSDSSMTDDDFSDSLSDEVLDLDERVFTDGIETTGYCQALPMATTATATTTTTTTQTSTYIVSVVDSEDSEIDLGPMDLAEPLTPKDKAVEKKK